jgi:hypothetical protein
MKFDVHIALTVMTYLAGECVAWYRSTSVYTPKKEESRYVETLVSSINLHGVTSQKYLQNYQNDFLNR